MVQCMAATTQRAEQMTVGELELGAGSILPGTQAALVGGGGGAEIRLDGEEVRVVYRIKTDLGAAQGSTPPEPFLSGLRQESKGATSPALLGLMLTGWKPEVRMEESATSESSPSFFRQ